MADQDSIQALEELERHIQHLMDLLNQADKDLQEAKMANDNYRAKHHQNEAQAGPITQAMVSIEDKLKELNTWHNQILAQIGEAKSAADQRTDEDDDNPYN